MSVGAFLDGPRRGASRRSWRGRLLVFEVYDEDVKVWSLRKDKATM
jgi:hypothetical protein